VKEGAPVRGGVGPAHENYEQMREIKDAGKGAAGGGGGARGGRGKPEVIEWCARCGVWRAGGWWVAPRSGQ